jgi:hypothetical protein
MFWREVSFGAVQIVRTQKKSIFRPLPPSQHAFARFHVPPSKSTHALAQPPLPIEKYSTLFKHNLFII